MKKGMVPALPVNLLIEGRLCLVVGGGKVALRKCMSLLAAGARVRVVSPEVHQDLAALAAQGTIEHVARAFKDDDVKPVSLVFACTDQRAVNRRILTASRKANVLCGCADGNWSAGDFTSPAVTRHGGLTIAVSTGGQSCRRAKLVKESLARHIANMETAELVVVGTDHRHLNLEQREPFHLSGKRLDRVGALLMHIWGVHEFMPLNTCNRIEIMAVASESAIQDGILTHALGVDRLGAHHAYCLKGPAAWEHSALVCAGMMSQTPGENHVVAQMKAALTHATRKGWAAGMLQEWVASALHLSKHIRNEVVPDIPVREIEELALRALGEFFRELGDRTIMIIGSGRVGRGLASGAVGAGARIIWCYHRNKPSLAPEWTGAVELCAWKDRDRFLSEADAVVCATEASEFVLNAAHAACFKRDQRVLLVDLGVPRNIDPALEQAADSVTIMDMEALKGMGNREALAMEAILARCRSIVHTHREQYERLMESFQGGNT